MPVRNDILPESELVFCIQADRFELAVQRFACGAPTRFLYPRTYLTKDLESGHVYAWVDGGPDFWGGEWQLLADMRFADEEEIEAFMRNAARLGLDSGGLHVRPDDEE